ncbi:MAG: F0F1 ATP synthase subunit delta [Spirochaetaceae bacterium]|jgi:F0F1-type ATP synthase delta subunit|nr:F0F1 ATP synthase subunit delta [Spirochaetaceae bacterium]
MFSADRWVQAFFNNAGTSATESLSVLKALINGLGIMYCEGTNDAQRLEPILRSALKKAGAESWGAELACRTVVLLVRKHLFNYSQDLITALEKELNRRSGIVTIILDSASPLEPEIRSSFIKVLKERTKADTVHITTRIMPALGGGYRLFMDNEVFDASVKAQVMHMSRSIMKF